MSTREAETEVLFGVTLSALARVHAAERAGVPLEERLRELGLSRTELSRAEQAWMEKLAASLRDDPGLFVAYDRALAEALASDGPKLLPYEEELGAWVSLEEALLGALNPAEVAKGVGLSLAEVARLKGMWAGRLAGDAALAEEAARKRAEGPGELPEVRREPRRRLASVAPSAPVEVPAFAAPVSPSPVVAPSPVSPAPVVSSSPVAPTPMVPAPVMSPPAVMSPPPAVAPPRGPVPMSTATGDINLAELMKGPLPFDPNAAAPPPAGAPAARPAPSFTGTGAVDLSKIRPGAVPFAPQTPPAAPPAPPAAAAAPVAHSSHSQQAPSKQASTETTELDLRAMFGAGAPMPFAAKPPAAGAGHPGPRPPVSPPPAVPPTAPPSPSPPDKTRPFSSETTDVDPALLAAILKKGPAPFKK